MADHDPDSPDARRRAVFADLVKTQDDGATVESSRAIVAERFGLTPAQVRDIERMGLARQWPPLA